MSLSDLLVSSLICIFPGAVHTTLFTFLQRHLCQICNIFKSILWENKLTMFLTCSGFIFCMFLCFIFCCTVLVLVLGIVIIFSSYIFFSSGWGVMSVMKVLYLGIVQWQLILRTLEDALTATTEQKGFVIIGFTQNERWLQTKTVYKQLKKDKSAIFKSHSVLSEITNSDPDWGEPELKGTSLTVCENSAALPLVLFCLFKHS